jgi:halocyanin-like protein
MRRSPTRRQYLHGTALAGLATAAGCLSAGSPGRTGDEPTDASTPSPPESLDQWLAGANGYDGDVRRYAPGAQPTIAVGEPVDGGMAFDPPVVEVAPTTNVRWDWTGHGGRHNVVALDGTFDSGRTNARPGTGYHYIFDEPGEHPFVSEPHRDEGMRGAVVVREPPATGNPAVDEWVVDSSNFDGGLAVRTDVDTATVRVGADGNGGHLAFDPPALKVSAGTTVEWRWTGAGGPHNVAIQTADVGSGDVVADRGVHFRHTFETPGTYRYACEPHRALGMKGAVVVV